MLTVMLWLKPTLGLEGLKVMLPPEPPPPELIYKLPQKAGLPERQTLIVALPLFCAYT